MERDEMHASPQRQSPNAKKPVHPWVAPFAVHGGSMAVLDALLVNPTTGQRHSIANSATDSVMELVGNDTLVDYAALDDEVNDEVCPKVPFDGSRALLPRALSPDLSSPSAAGVIGALRTTSPLAAVVARRSTSPALSVPVAVSSKPLHHHAPTVATTAELEESARSIARLRKELEQLRATNALRERELNSIVANCRSAIRAEVERENRKAMQDLHKTIEGLERNADQLKSIIAKREASLREKNDLLNHQKELISEALRERDLHWKVIEGDLRSEVARLRSEREKQRFEAEVANSRSSTSASALDMQQQRAHEAELRWIDTAQRQLIITESNLRIEIEAHAVSITNGFAAAAAALQRLDDYYTLRADERWHTIHDVLYEALQYDGEVSRERLMVVREQRMESMKRDKDASLAQDITLSAAEEMIFELIQDRAVQWTEWTRQIKEDETRRNATLEALQSGVTNFYQQLSELDATSALQNQSILMRVSTAEKRVELCRETINSHTKSRVAGKANQSVVEVLVAEHQGEMQAVSSLLKTTQLELEETKRLNMVDECYKLRAIVQRMESANHLKTTECNQPQQQLQSLKAAMRHTEEGAREQASKVSIVTDERDAAKRQLAEADANLRSQLSNLNERLRDAEKALEKSRNRSEELHDALGLEKQRTESLQIQLTKLKEKFVQEKTDDVVARVNHKLASAGASSSASFPAASGHEGAAVDAAEAERLRQKILVLRKENDTLIQRLDSALAEASHAEEQRRNAIERTLQIMAKEDAGPKRELMLRGAEAELQRRLKTVEERERDVEVRHADVTRREAQLRSRGSAVGTGTDFPTGSLDITEVHTTTGVLQPSWSRQNSAARKGSSGLPVRLTTPPVTPGGADEGSGRGAAGRTGPVRLLPLSQRPMMPRTENSKSDEVHRNPQKYGGP